MEKQKIILITVIALLLISNIFFIIKYSNSQEELERTQIALEEQSSSQEVLSFTKLFINKILKAEEDIDYDTQVELKIAIDNLDDEEISKQWKEFVESETSFDAQNKVKDLLENLINKI